MTEEETLFCVNHPNVETRLRCNRCGNPICPKCAIRTPVGFRCPQCVKTQQAVFYTASTVDYIIAAVVSLALSLPAYLVITRLGWFIFFLAPAAGIGIAEVVRRLTRRRRGRWIWLVVAASIVLTALPFMLFAFVPLLFLPASGSPDQAGTFFVSLLFQVGYAVLYLVLVVGAAIARLR
ncbi:MAG: hypothetical protein NUW24_12335 [Anaerolineae bacterium]|jgi:hypothetical protein|nr:hypothetical protein [Anaerolineae bacterium]MDH7474880.1 hypothetical protein [Anaerolineae bacterium]